jgi:DNA-directed RNA polymerase subunit beta'
MKENVITGNLIPAGTGQREFEKLIVGSREEFERIEATRDSLTQDVVVEEAEHE